VAKLPFPISCFLMKSPTWISWSRLSLVRGERVDDDAMMEVGAGGVDQFGVKVVMLDRVCWSGSVKDVQA